MTEVLPLISNVCGWIYVISWGLFAYPQIYLNFKLKSVEGFKLDYPFLNITGFIFYSISYGTAYFSDLPFDNYGLGTVRIQDVVFSFHNLAVNLILNLQSLFYKRGKNKLTLFSLVYTVFAYVSGAFVYYASEVQTWIPVSEKFNILIYLGYLKVFISFTKYIPLIYWNYVRRNTKGVSIVSILFDLIGSLTSFAQVTIDYIDETTKTLSPLKVTLAIVVAFYDLIIIFQHYVLYGYKKTRQSCLIKDLNIAINSPLEENEQRP